MRVERQEKSQQPRRPITLPPRPRFRSQRVGEQAGDPRVNSARHAQRHPGLRSPQQIHGSHQRRLVEPDVPIENAPAAHLQGGGERKVVPLPQNARMAQVHGQQKREQSTEKQNSSQNVLVWYKARGEQTTKMTITEQLAHLRQTVARIDRKYSGLPSPPPARQNEPNPAGFVEELLSGQVVETPFGKHFETEKLYARHKRHGSYEISDLIELPHDVLAALSDG